MRWLFIAILLINVSYLGWELQRQAGIDRGNTRPSIMDSTGLTELLLISETDVVPETYVYGAEPGTAAGLQTDQSELLFALPENGLVVDLPDITMASLDEGTTGMFCYTFGPIEEEILATGVEDWFKSRRAWTDVRYSEESGQLFWVYLAPSAGDTDAVSIIRDLEDQGISDYRVVNSGNLLNAISLGLYTSQAAVNERIGDLEQKGYKPVVVPYRSGKRVYWVDVRLNMEPGALETVFQGYPARYNYIPVDCARLSR